MNDMKHNPVRIMYDELKNEKRCDMSDEQYVKWYEKGYAMYRMIAGLY